MDIVLLKTIVQLTQILVETRSVLIIYNNDTVSDVQWLSEQFISKLIPTGHWNIHAGLDIPSTFFSQHIFTAVLLMIDSRTANYTINFICKRNLQYDGKWIYYSHANNDEDPLTTSEYWMRLEYPQKTIIVKQMNETGCMEMLIPDTQMVVGHGGCQQLDFNLSQAHRQWASVESRHFIATTVNRNNVQGIVKAKDSVKGYGMIFDILDMMSGQCNFSYSPILSPDNFYGTKQTNGSWDGMMKQIIAQEAHLTAAVFQVTQERSEVVDFSIPIFDEEMQILQIRPKAARSGEGIFYPFTKQVWILLLLTIIVVATAAFALMALNVRLLHSQWGITFGDSVWIIIRLLLAQAGKPTKYTLTSGRFLLVAWGVFTVIISSMYTANLTAFLTIPKYDVAIRDLKHLQVKKDIRWMVKQSAAFISEIESDNPTFYTTLLPDLISGRAFTVSSDSDAVEYVLKKGYVYLQKETTVETLILNDLKTSGECRLTVGQQTFFRTPTSMAFPKGSPLRKTVDHFVLQLKAYGITDHLYSKYYPTVSGVCQLNTMSPKDDTQPILLQSFDYTYLILISGTVLAVVVLIVECLYKKTPRIHKLSKRCSL